MEHGIFRTFQQTASRLTSDPQLQKDLMQEMFVHLLEVRQRQPGEPADWYIRQCETHAREYLVRARGAEVAPVTMTVEVVRTERLTDDQVEWLRPKLSARQQQVFEWLRRGYGIRETARQLGISHPAVIKHRNKISRVLQELVPHDGFSRSAVAGVGKNQEVALGVT